MKEKYYTPTIEEFHIGFEYEFTDSPTNTDWTKAVVRDGAQIDDITRKHKGESVYSLRVKYLDREDIESLGFKPDFSDYFLKIQDKPDASLVTLGDNCVAISIDDDTIFLGTIKNKSELKKVMQQLGI